MTTRLFDRLTSILVACSLLGLLGSIPATATESVTYLHTDVAGSPVAATDANGNIIWRESYRPYGERTKNQAAPGSNRQFFHDKPFDQDSGLSYFGARYYDPVVGRFMGVDPKGFGEKNLHSFNRYAYGNNNPNKYVDLDGRDSIVANGRVYLVPVVAGVPGGISIPNNVGASGVSSSSWRFHSYDVATSTDLTNTGAIGEAIKNNPTPGNDSPASPMGTVNNVGELPTAGKDNFVRSYSIPSPDPSRYTDITVNYTISGKHGMQEGYVMKYGEIGPNGSITLHSYGEGNARRQSGLFGGFWWRGAVDSTWQQNHREIINAVE